MATQFHHPFLDIFCVHVARFFPNEEVKIQTIYGKCLMRGENRQKLKIRTKKTRGMCIDKYFGAYDFTNNSRNPVEYGSLLKQCG